MPKHDDAVTLRDQLVDPVLDDVPIPLHSLEIRAERVACAIRSQVLELRRGLGERTKGDVLIAQAHPMVDRSAAALVPAAVGLLERGNVGSFLGRSEERRVGKGWRWR